MLEYELKKDVFARTDLRSILPWTEWTTVLSRKAFQTRAIFENLHGAKNTGPQKSMSDIRRLWSRWVFWTLPQFSLLFLSLPLDQSTMEIPPFAFIIPFFLLPSFPGKLKSPLPPQPFIELSFSLSHLYHWGIIFEYIRWLGIYLCVHILRLRGAISHNQNTAVIMRSEILNSSQHSKPVWLDLIWCRCFWVETWELDWRRMQVP